MIGIVGIVVIFVMVFGGYLLAGGKMAIILKSLPYEMLIIGGAAVGDCHGRVGGEQQICHRLADNV